MARAEVKTFGLTEWIRGFDDLPATCAREAVPIWRGATEYMFSRTQEVVHVLSGDLKATGTTDTRLEEDHVVGEISYGGGDVRYAVFEAAYDYADAGDYEVDTSGAPGGQHDYLTRAYVDSQHIFTAAQAEVWEQVAGEM